MANRIEYCILIFNTHIPRTDIYQDAKILKGVNAFLCFEMSLMSGEVERSHGRGFVFRVRLGDYEVELCGDREEVLQTVADLPSLMANVQGAFEAVKPKTVATLTVKTDAATTAKERVTQKYPKIVRTEKCDEAVLRILESDWGKWRPRTVAELKDALEANELHFSGHDVAAVLLGLVRKGIIRRWKTDAGQVYILAEKEELAK